jgi:hypothetical protein
MLSGLLAVLIVGTLAGSVETDRDDGRYRTLYYPRYDHGSTVGAVGIAVTLAAAVTTDAVAMAGAATMAATVVMAGKMTDCHG